MNEVIEIERKWVLPTLPKDVAPIKQHEIEQVYLGVRGLRLRKKDHAYLMTYKGKGSLSRSEWEQEIPEWTYQGLTAEATATLYKTRYIYDGGAVEIEVDEYHKSLKGLYTIEAEWTVEIPSKLSQTKRQQLINNSEEAARGYKLPVEFANTKEVTGVEAYKNRSLATNGLPK
jgi:CYTH domain-containing protein